MVKNFISTEELMAFVDFSRDGTATVKENLVCEGRVCTFMTAVGCVFASKSSGGMHMDTDELINSLGDTKCPIICHLQTHSGEDMSIRSGLFPNGTSLVATKVGMVGQISNGIIEGGITVKCWDRVIVIGVTHADDAITRLPLNGYMVNVTEYDGVPIRPGTAAFIESRVLHSSSFAIVGEEP